MTNLEKYKKQIPELIYNTKDQSLAVVDSKVIHCRDARCSECEFSKNKREYVGINCFGKLLVWLCEEYQEPSVDWYNVAVDTKILVSDDGEKWFKRYFAKYEDGKVFTWLNGSTSWTADDIPAITTKRYTSWEYAKLAEEDAE